MSLGPVVPPQVDETKERKKGVMGEKKKKKHQDQHSSLLKCIVTTVPEPKPSTMLIYIEHKHTNTKTDNLFWQSH